MSDDDARAHHDAQSSHRRVLTAACSPQISRDARPYEEIFAARRESLVYLTADSPNELTELRAEDVYIVGGIVDRNRHKARLELHLTHTECSAC